MKPIKSIAIESYVNGLNNFQKEIVLAIREVVLSADERVKEGMKWSSIAFFNQQNLCGFRVAKSHITLLFMQGALLTDTHGILQGTGSKARTYKVTTITDINAKALIELVQECLKLGL